MDLVDQTVRELVIGRREIAYEVTY